MKKIIRTVIFGLIIGVIFLISLLFIKRIYRTYQYNNNNYYRYYTSKVKIKQETEMNKKNDYITAIEHTTKYKNQKIKNKSDAIELIQKEAVIQEKKCNNNLKKIEKEIETITGIYGVNLCEISINDAENIKETLEYIYKNYPIIKEYLTNITLVNDGGINSYIAAFKPSFTFATSNTQNKFPFVIKMQVFLNASYFLNNDYFDLIIENAKSSNHFPPNTTKTSLVVHEFGHVLTYVLALKEENLNTLVLKYSNFKVYSNTLKEYTESTFSEKIVRLAYQNILKEKEETLEMFRENISGYAKTTDEYGNPLYNETIAEAFHDYYLNQGNAKEESIEIIKILNQYIEKLM